MNFAAPTHSICSRTCPSCIPSLLRKKSDPDLRFCGNYLSGNLRDTGIFGVSRRICAVSGDPPFLTFLYTIWFRRISASSRSSTPLFWTTLMVIRARSFYLQKVFNCGILHLAVRHYHTDPRTPHRLLYGEAAERDHGQSLCHTGSCDLENRLAPAIFHNHDHFSPDRQYPGPGSFNQAHLIARILLLVCMFLTSHTQILLLQFF